MTDKIYAEPKKPRYHRIDGWRGYQVPTLAVCGTSYTGEWDDSPCKGSDVRGEIKRLQKEVLRPAGIKSRTRAGNSSNIFCAKLWVVVAREDFEKAVVLTLPFLKDRDIVYLHDADTDQLGYEA